MPTKRMALRHRNCAIESTDHRDMPGSAGCIQGSRLSVLQHERCASCSSECQSMAPAGALWERRTVEGFRAHVERRVRILELSVDGEELPVVRRRNGIGLSVPRGDVFDAEHRTELSRIVELGREMDLHECAGLQPHVDVGRLERLDREVSRSWGATRAWLTSVDREGVGGRGTDHARRRPAGAAPGKWRRFRLNVNCGVRS